MARIPSRNKDNWGKRPRTPFQIWLHQNPKRAAFISAGFTIALILFWISVIMGLAVFIIVAIA